MNAFEKFIQDLYGAVIREDRWQLYLEGLINTVLIALTACLIGIFIGLIVSTINYVAATKESRLWKAAAALCSAYTTVIRGTPIIVQLLILYNLSYFTEGLYASIIGFGINSGAYVSEIFRSGLNSIDIGQKEAGRSLGLGQWKTMRLIILPQAFKNVLPALGNEMIVLLKETSISGYVGTMDLTKGGDIIRSTTYEAYLPLFGVAAIYLVIVMLMTAGVNRLERKLRTNER